MKTRNLILVIALVFGISSVAQAQDQPTDSTAKGGKVEVKVSSKNGGQAEIDEMVIPLEGGKLHVYFEADTVVKKDSCVNTTKKKTSRTYTRDFWSGIDFGFNGYMTKSGQTEMAPGFERFNYNLGKSTYLGFNLFERSMRIYKHNVVLLTGLGIDYNNYRFDTEEYAYGKLDTATGKYPTQDYITNRLKTFYATMPLMLGLDFSKPGKKGLHVAAGVVGGVRFASYTKEKFTLEGVKVKKNSHDDFNLNPFRLNAQARVGYGDFTLFANYSLTTMYKKNSGMPEVYPFSFGISFGG